MDVSDPKEIVRRGYDAVSVRYDEAYGAETKYAVLLGELRTRLPEGGSVLDLGCGSGVPVARALAADGCRVTGVDLSEVQVRRARERVPRAEFLHADATSVVFPDGSFDAVVCLYTLIHVPLAEQPGLLERIARWLRPGGWFVAATGERAWTGVEDDWLGGGAPMWWSQPDATTSREWITRAGLVVEREEFLPEGDGGHVLFWARRVPPASVQEQPQGE
jgi:ubiquinone/menaquinone biosynthesis C-methylase UbiE